ncbi:hypothetical protein Tco_1001930 [Tanacetum coccineum]|uniref:Uncharacterized protein n=1 Tax=Tanacetum coccineum TaxID=301880 RepID=A0ABQ5F586_9ASTR
MSTLTSADTHNMVTFLEKPGESNGFHEIIDFMNANQIPLIDKKKVIIMELSIRSDLHLEDAGGTDYLPTATIFEELARIGEGITLVAQEENKQDDIVPKPLMIHISVVVRISMQLSELDSFDAQANEIADLKKKVQKLGRRKKSRATGLKRLRKVGMARRVESSEDKESLVSDTQGRSDNEELFDTSDLHDDEVNVDMPVGEKQEITLAQTLFKSKQLKPKDVTIACYKQTTTTKTKQKGTEESSKGTEDELEADKSKKAESSEEKAKGRKKILDREGDDEVELKKHLVIIKDDEIAIDAIPLATKPPMIVEYKLLKEGIMVHYQLIRADGSSKRYSSLIRMLQDINREYLETLWKLVKTKHGDTRPEG